MFLHTGMDNLCTVVRIRFRGIDTVTLYIWFPKRRDQKRWKITVSMKMPLKCTFFLYFITHVYDVLVDEDLLYCFSPGEEWISESWNTTPVRFVAAAFGGSRFSWYNSQWRPQYASLFNQKPRDTHWLNWWGKWVSVSWLLIGQKLCIGLYRVLYHKNICLADTAGMDFVW